MSRMNADAQVPGPPKSEKELNPQPPDKMLHVEMRPDDKFTLIWKPGGRRRQLDRVPRHPIEINEATSTPSATRTRTKVNEEWKGENGSHRDAVTKKLDQAVCTPDNKTLFKEMSRSSTPSTRRSETSAPRRSRFRLSTSPFS